MRIALGAGATIQILMKTHESTYALLVRSEERQRGFLETVLYAFFILSAVAAIWQFAQQPVTVPAPGIEAAPCLACSSTIQPPAPATLARQLGG
jgi:hypothetical protein